MNESRGSQTSDTKKIQERGDSDPGQGLTEPRDGSTPLSYEDALAL